MSSPRSRTGRAVAIYTVLRVALFLAVWLTIELVTPISGLWAIVLAILVSGAVSLVVLDRPRNTAGVAVGGFFSRLNERIDAATRSEDVDEEPSGQGEQPAEQESVNEKAQPGVLERRDEGGSDRSS